MLYRRAAPNDLLETHLAAKFLFQVEFLLGELVLEFGNLPVRQRVFNGNGYLTRRLAEKLDVLLREGSFCYARDPQNAQGSAMVDERNETGSFHALSRCQLAHLSGDLFQITVGYHNWGQRLKSSRAGIILVGDDELLFPNKAFSMREIESVYSELPQLPVIQQDGNSITLHKFANV